MYYQELGFVNTRQMFRDAYERHYAVPALYFISIEQVNAIFDACSALRSPVILLASPNLRAQLGSRMTARVVQAAMERCQDAGLPVPAALHLDHGKSYDACVEAIEGGFSSVMIDGSALPFEENVALTRRVIDYAHRYQVTVEAELGALGDEHLGADHLEYTSPEMVERFVRETGADSLAISVGTSHGMVKRHPNPDGTYPELRYDILREVDRRLPGFPIVLHGASNLPQDCIDMINRLRRQYSERCGHSGRPADKSRATERMQGQHCFRRLGHRHGTHPADPCGESGSHRQPGIHQGHKAGA